MLPLQAIRTMDKLQIQRLPVVDESSPMSSTVLHIVTYPRILRYVMAHFHDDNDELLHKSIDELKIGTFNTAEVVTVGTETSLIEVFELMIKQNIHCVPIVDEECVVVDVVSQADVTLVARSVSYDFLQRPARSLLLEHGSPQETLHTCMRSEALISVLRRLVATGAHRLICVDVSGHLEGMVTLNDIFSYFIQQYPVGEPASEAQAGSTVEAEEDESEQFGRFCVTDLSDL